MTGRPLLEPGTVPPNVRPLRIALVGAYGIKIEWSDGHDAGIYSYQTLRAL